MQFHRRRVATLLFTLLTACEADRMEHAFGPAAEPSRDAADAAARKVVVLTRNLYVGADVDAVIAALVTPAPDDDLAALAAAVETLRRTDWPARAGAVAAEIGKARPHVIGLQEVSTVDLTLPPLGVDVHLDFLPILLSELAARGLDYTVAARIRNIEATPLPGVSLVDEDVLLVDAHRVAVRNTTARRFATNLGPVAPGVVLQRGWVSAEVTIAGRDYSIASTHLESGAQPGLDQLRAAQAMELAAALAGSPSAVIMGDLNDVPGSPMYQVLSGAGFSDAWAELRPGTRGYTCCHAKDLSNLVTNFGERIDYVLVRGTGDGDRRVTGRISLLGEVPADRVAGPEYPIWASDHAGLTLAWRVIEAGPLP
jgi:endonuclease/exonuclease/phosphatase family metal-dependent hydrolase